MSSTYLGANPWPLSTKTHVCSSREVREETEGGVDVIWLLHVKRRRVQRESVCVAGGGGSRVLWC